MFRTTDQTPTPAFKLAIEKAERSYIIRPNDLLDISVYTNKGEVLIDPIKALPGGESINAGSASTPGGGAVASASPSSNTFLVSPDGTVNLPMVGIVNLDGLNLNEVDSTLQKAYNKYYEETFVVSKLLNKRIIFLGSGGGKVIPLTHPNMNLLEVLAIAGVGGGGGGGGARQQANATNIRLIRGDLKNPGVIVVNLSNIQGLMEHDLSMQHGDVVYVEPIVRPIAETIQEYAPLLTILTQLLTLYFIFERTN